jgi:hypothetical protein
MERVAYRTPLKFGGVPSTRATVLTVKVRVETRDGRSAWGTRRASLSATSGLPVEKRTRPPPTPRNDGALAGKIARKARSGDVAHPASSPTVSPVCRGGDVARELQLADPMPNPERLSSPAPLTPRSRRLRRVHNHHLNAMVVIGWSRTCRPTSTTASRARAWRRIRAAKATPKPHLPLYHLVGASIADRRREVKERLTDGLPNTLGEWIASKDQLHPHLR